MNFSYYITLFHLSIRLCYNDIVVFAILGPYVIHVGFIMSRHSVQSLAIGFIGLKCSNNMYEGTWWMD